MTRRTLLAEACAWERLAEKRTAPYAGMFLKSLLREWTPAMDRRFIAHMELVDATDPGTTDLVLDMLWLAEECREEAGAMP